MNAFEKMLPALIILPLVGTGLYIYRDVKLENDQHIAEAAAAGFSDYDDMQAAKAAGFKDQAAWAARKQQIEAERRQRADAKDVEERAEKSRRTAALIELNRNPIDRMEVKNFNWEKGGFGSVALVTFTISNDNDFAVKDIGVSCKFSAPSGTVVSTAGNVIFDTIKPKSQRTFAKQNIGFIHSQSARASCSVERAKKL